MSILVVGAAGELGAAVVARLVDQGDDGRVVEPDEAAIAGWRELGAHVARGSPDDADLVERAAQNVRTVVVLDGALVMPELLRGARAARVPRFVVCADARAVAPLAEAGVDYVVLVVPRTRFARRPSRSPAEVAEAVDAADDLAGNPRMVVDLTTPEGWAALGIDAARP
jgi:hypothetical protein